MGPAQYSLPVTDGNPATASAQSRWEEGGIDAEEFAAESVSGKQRCTKHGALIGGRKSEVPQRGNVLKDVRVFVR